LASQRGNRTDRGLVERLRKRGGESILRCIQCGTCTSSCTVNAITSSYNPRRLIQIILTTGLVPGKEDVWLCATCGICVERCPRNVSPMDIILATRCLLFEEAGKIPPDSSRALRSVLRFGRAVKPRANIKERRAALGLPKLGPDSGDLSQIRGQLKAAGLLRLAKIEKKSARRNSK